MDGPEGLVSHYASLAFYTRIAALTFVGGIVGVMHQSLKDPEVQYVVGVGILLVIGALAEFNRRYTFAYVAAVYAASNADTHSVGPDQAAVARWESFRKLNDLTSNTVCARMLLSWLTYVPGFILGEYLLLTCRAPSSGVVAVSLGVGISSWLVWLAIGRYPTSNKAPKTLYRATRRVLLVFVVVFVIVVPIALLLNKVLGIAR